MIPVAAYVSRTHCEIFESILGGDPSSKIRRYYSDHFPYEWVEWFLTLGGKFPLNRREFAFRWQPDVVKRNQDFKTVEDAQFYMDVNHYPSNERATSIGTVLPLRFGTIGALRKFLIEKQPHSIDIGPLYQSLAHVSSDRKDPYAPKLSALQFDIDLKDYGGACECHKKKLICDQCWIQYLRPALIDLVNFLTETMQFDTSGIIPVYSAGAGFHVFVIHERVWKWDDSARQALIEHLPKSIICDPAIVLNHLIKLPFSPHKSNRCLSLPIVDIASFVPSAWRIKIEDVDDELMRKLKMIS